MTQPAPATHPPGPRLVVDETCPLGPPAAAAAAASSAASHLGHVASGKVGLSASVPSITTTARWRSSGSVAAVVAGATGPLGPTFPDRRCPRREAVAAAAEAPRAGARAAAPRTLVETFDATRARHTSTLPSLVSSRCYRSGGPSAAAPAAAAASSAASCLAHLMSGKGGPSGPVRPTTTAARWRSSGRRRWNRSARRNLAGHDVCETGGRRRQQQHQLRKTPKYLAAKSSDIRHGCHNE